ncbi:hypothetical protein Hanom_Chr00s000004g01608211 [Helianthus anomalus]
MLISQPNEQAKSCSDSVEIISFGPFSPYKSHLAREFGAEVFTPYDDEYAEAEGELDDTANALETFNKNLKIPTVKIHSRSRVVRF